MAATRAACLAGDFAAARAPTTQYLPLMNVNFVESNPIPVKAAMALMGLLEPVWRLPLVPPRPPAAPRIDKVLEEAGCSRGARCRLKSSSCSMTPPPELHRGAFRGCSRISSTP